MRGSSLSSPAESAKAEAEAEAEQGEEGKGRAGKITPGVCASTG